MIPLCIVSLLLSGPETVFVESRIDVPGRVIGFDCPDVDDDERGDLAVAFVEEGRRSLWVFLQRDGYAFARDPDWRWTLPDEVVAYAFSDVRPDEGRELLLLGRGGLYSVGVLGDSVRESLRREIEASAFPDLADPGRLPFFDWVVDLDRDGIREILLPTAGALLVFARGRSGAGFVAADSVPLREIGENPSTNIRIGIGSSTVETRERELPSVMFPGAPASFPLVDVGRLVDARREFRAPRLLDFDGDGVLDAVRVEWPRVFVREGAGGGRFDAVEREAWTYAGEREGEADTEIRLADIDGDGRPEVLIVEEDGDGLDREFAVTVFPHGAEGVSDAASARLRFRASSVDVRFVDVDGDGVLDLVADRIELPSALESLTRIRVESSLLVFRGGPGATLSTKPDLRFDRSLSPEDLRRIREVFVLDLGGDYDGDGRLDLLSIQPDGLVQIRRTVPDGGGIAFADAPMSVYLPARPVRAAVPSWISRDVVSDLVLRHEDGLTVFVSKEDAR